MNNVEIKVFLDPTCAAQVEALTTLLTIIGETTIVVPEVSVKTPRVRNRKKAGVEVQTTGTPAIEKPLGEKPEGEKPEGEKPENTGTPVEASDLTIEILRSEASRKAKFSSKNRPLIKKKLKEFGASNIVKLGPMHFVAFNEFLNTL